MVSPCKSQWPTKGQIQDQVQSKNQEVFTIRNAASSFTICRRFCAVVRLFAPCRSVAAAAAMAATIVTVAMAVGLGALYPRRCQDFERFCFFRESDWVVAARTGIRPCSTTDLFRTRCSRTSEKIRGIVSSASRKTKRLAKQTYFPGKRPQTVGRNIKEHLQPEGRTHFLEGA